MGNPDKRPEQESAVEIWKEIMEEAKHCRRTWGMGFPVISTHLLRKYWKRATGYEPPP